MKTIATKLAFGEALKNELNGFLSYLKKYGDSEYPGSESAYLVFDANAFDAQYVGNEEYGLYYKVRSVLEYAKSIGKRFSIQFLVHDPYAGGYDAYRRCAYVPAVGDESDPLTAYPLLQEIGGVVPPSYDHAYRRVTGYARASYATMGMISKLREEFGSAAGSPSNIDFEVRKTDFQSYGDTVLFSVPGLVKIGLYAPYMQQKCNRFTPCFRFADVDEYGDFKYQFNIRWALGSPGEVEILSVEALSNNLMDYHRALYPAEKVA